MPNLKRNLACGSPVFSLAKSARRRPSAQFNTAWLSPYYKLGSRIVYRGADVLAYLEANRVNTQPSEAE